MTRNALLVYRAEEGTRGALDRTCGLPAADSDGVGRSPKGGKKMEPLLSRLFTPRPVLTVRRGVAFLLRPAAAAAAGVLRERGEERDRERKRKRVGGAVWSGEGEGGGAGSECWLLVGLTKTRTNK
jgi:hypothetical protein